MSVLGNLLWLILGGFVLGLLYLLLGLIYCLTIIGIPFGYQLIKIGLFAMLPFGREPDAFGAVSGCMTVGFNILWILFGGIELALAHLVLGVLFCITIIGIPFGMQHFKLMKLALFPFGQGVK